MTSRVIHQGQIITLKLEQARMPDGRIVELEIVEHPGGAAVVALDGNDQVCLLNQYRHAAGGWILELPAGKHDAGDTPFNTAQRELAEEAGLVARNWTALGSIISSPGVFTEVVHLFLARDLTAVSMQHEKNEFIELRWLPFAEALAHSRAGDITDAKTVIGLFRAASLLATG